MTSTEIAIAPRENMRLTNEQLTYIANTEFVPKGKRGNLPAILACVATGRELGIGDMAALKNIHLVDGSPSYSAELMVMLVRRYGHSITGTFTDGAVTVKGRRADNGDEIAVEWTMAMAERAGLANKANWKHYPEAMLWARAVSQLCRMLFADCFAGGTYTAEELGDETPPNEMIEEGTLQHPEGEPVDDGKFPPPDDAPIAVQRITEPQRVRLRAIQKECGVSDDTLKKIVALVAGVQSSKDIPAVRYEALVAAVQQSGAALEAAEGESQFKIPEGVS